MLLEAKADVNATDEDSCFPLMSAVARDSQELAKQRTDVKTDCLPRQLIEAAARETRAIVEMLLEAKANVNTADDEGGTPLIRASQEGASHISLNLPKILRIPP